MCVREIHMASPVAWIRQLSGASLDLSHSDLVRYRCYKRTSVGAQPVHLRICMLLLRRAYTWYMVCVRVCTCACVQRTPLDAVSILSGGVSRAVHGDDCVRYSRS